MLWPCLYDHGHHYILRHYNLFFLNEKNDVCSLGVSFYVAVQSATRHTDKKLEMECVAHIKLVVRRNKKEKTRTVLTPFMQRKQNHAKMSLA